MMREITRPTDVAAEGAERDLEPDSAAAVAGSEATDRAGADSYTDMLLKHIPAETITAYLALDGLIRSSAHHGITAWLWAIFSLCLVVTPLYLWRLQGVHSPVQLAVSTVSFAIWVFSIGGAFTRYSWYEPWTASAMLVCFTLLVPVLLGAKPTLRTS